MALKIDAPSPRVPTSGPDTIKAPAAARGAAFGKLPVTSDKPPEAFQTANLAAVSAPSGVGPQSIQWWSPVTATRVHGTNEEPAPIDNLVFRTSEFGNPGNMRFDASVWAPGVSDTWLDKQAAVSALNLTVESPLIPDGKRPMQYAGQAGIEGHDLKVSTSLADMIVGGSLKPGVYPVKIKAGPLTLREFTIEIRD
jgi:hypothetical protein